jgi:hypothetical protein
MHEKQHSRLPSMRVAQPRERERQAETPVRGKALRRCLLDPKNSEDRGWSSKAPYKRKLDAAVCGILRRAMPANLDIVRSIFEAGA